MSNLEQTLMRELATLPKSRLGEVINFVRYLKISIDEESLEKEYDDAINEARKISQKYNITQDDINAEIRAVREGKQ